MKEMMLQIENAGIAYGDDLLFSGFNLQLHAGEMVRSEEHTSELQSRI